MSTDPTDFMGATLWPGFLDDAAQAELIGALRAVLQRVPLVRHVTPGGRPMSVRMSAAGRFGWISDRAGYRYAQRHPNGSAWPPIPDPVLAIWECVAQCPRPPECCLINWYEPGARMGLHQDRDEADFACPVVSISLGDDGLFRIGGTERRAPTRSVWLRSGDVVVLGGAARLAYHGIDRTRTGLSGLFPGGGRLNLTLRVVT